VTAAILEEDTDKGLADARGGLARLCLATGEAKPVEEMIRYVVAPDGAIVPDLAKKLPGRGAWVLATEAALKAAIEKKAFARAFRGKGKADANLPALVEKLLSRTALDSLSIANKAGRVVSGFEKVKERLTGDRVIALLHASDARPDGRAKLNAAAKLADPDAPKEIRLFSGEQLDLALGRSNVVHAALLDHAACRAFLANCVRYERWREPGPRADKNTGRSRGDQEVER
jgi:predicted RNA-binding protein YlxR (DUF448 family)/ribosomal protein L30E